MIDHLEQDLRRLIALLSNPGAFAETLDAKEWNRIIDLAGKHRIAQTLQTCLKANPAITVAPDAGARIRNIYLSSIALNTKTYHNLDIILGALEKSGVAVVPIKGSWLAEAVYQNIALRLSSDVDLWVQKEQIDKARQVLVSLGYAYCAEKADRPQALQDALTGETQMVKPGTPMVELHWNIFHGEWFRHTGRIDEQEVWKRTLPFHGETVRQMAPEDAVILICVHHPVNHNMAVPGLRPLLDLHYMIQKLPIDWDTVAKRALAWRVSTATWLLLQMYAEMFGDPKGRLPLHALEPSALRRKILSRFVTLRKLACGIELVNGSMRFLFLLALVDKPADAFYLIWRGLVPDRQWLTLRYNLQDAPAWRFWLQRFLHPLRLIWIRKI